MSDKKLDDENVKFERRTLKASGVLGFFARAGYRGCVDLSGAGRHVWLSEALREGARAASHLLFEVPTPPRVSQTPGDAVKFAPRRLETNAGGQLDDQRPREEEILNIYGWLTAWPVLHIFPSNAPLPDCRVRHADGASEGDNICRKNRY